MGGSALPQQAADGIRKTAVSCAIHYITAQHHTAPQQHSNTHHSTAPHHSTTHHITSQHSTTHHSTAPHITAAHITAQHHTSQHSTTHHSTTHHSTASHITAPHITAQHSTTHHSTTHHHRSQQYTSQHSNTHHSTDIFMTVWAFCLPPLAACLYRVDVRMDRSFRTYLVSHSNGRQRLVWALPALDHSSNDTQWPAPLPLWQLAVSDHNIRSSDLASFPFTFTLSGANNVRNVVMSDGQQTYHLQHRSCDGAAILVQEATFLVTADVLH